MKAEITERGLEISGVPRGGIYEYEIFEDGLNGITLGYTFTFSIAKAMALQHLADYRGGCKRVWVQSMRDGSLRHFDY